MTRKKAIEAAMERIRANADTSKTIDMDCNLIVPSMFDICDELEAIWSEARCAGLREAARIAEKNPDHPEWIIDAKADELAKKARNK